MFVFCPAVVAQAMQLSTLAVAGKILSTPSDPRERLKGKRYFLYTSPLGGIWANLLLSICDRRTQTSEIWFRRRMHSSFRSGIFCEGKKRWMGRERGERQRNRRKGRMLVMSIHLQARGHFWVNSTVASLYCSPIRQVKYDSKHLVCRNQSIYRLIRTCKL